MSKITDDEERAELRGLDAEVAVEVMGWQVIRGGFPSHAPEGWNPDMDEWKPAPPVPHYSTDIAAAWEMEGELAGLGALGEYVRRLTEMTFPVTFAEKSGLSSGARARFYQNTPAETFLLLRAPLERRCRAALAAVRGRR